MIFQPHRIRPLAVAGVLLLAAACGGDKAKSGDESGATAGDVDQKSEATITEREAAAFTAPADSSVTPQQVEAYLKTSLLQFDLIRAEAPRLHQQVAEMEKRGKAGGALAGLRNMAQGMNMVGHWADLVGGSYIRSARTLKYNPAEMEYVRERMGAVSGYLLTKPMLEMGKQSAAQLRQQAQAMRGQEGVTEEQVQALMQQADEMEKNASEQSVSPALLANYEALRKARPNVTDAMWTGIGMAGGAQGLMALNNLGDANDTTTTRQLNQFRQLYTDALANKVSPGMENKPAGSN